MMDVDVKMKDVAVEPAEVKASPKLQYVKYTLKSELYDKSYSQIDFWRVWGDSDKFADLAHNISTKLKGEGAECPPLGAYSHYGTGELSNNKTYAIMFSGGYDSTSLAIRHLQKGDNVILCGVLFEENAVFYAELTAKILRHIYGDDRVAGLFLVSGQLANNNNDISGLQQQPFTALFAAMLEESVKSKVEAVECAYIMNDDALSYLEELKNLYNARAVFYEQEKFPPLTFPLTKKKHWENVTTVKDFEEEHHVILPVYGAGFPTTGYVREGNNLWSYCSNFETCNHENKEGGDGFGYIIRIKDYFAHRSEKSIYEKLSLLNGYDYSSERKSFVESKNKEKAIKALTELMEEGILTKKDLEEQLTKDIKMKEKHNGRLVGISKRRS